MSHAAEHSADVRAALAALTQSTEYWQARRALKEELIRPKYTASQLESQIPRLVEQLGLATKLRNVLHEHCERLHAQAGKGLPSTDPVGEKHPAKPPSSPSHVLLLLKAKHAPPSPPRKSAAPSMLKGEQHGLAALTQARDQWQVRAVGRLQLLARSASQPLAGARRHDGEEGEEWEHSGVYRPSDAPRTFVYSVTELFHALTGIPSAYEIAKKQGIAVTVSMGAPQLGILRMSLKAPSLMWLRKFFSELHIKHRQVGLDDRLHEWYEQERYTAGETCATLGSIPECRLFARSGIPNGVRPKVWANALGLSSLSEKHRKYYQSLLEDVDSRNLFTDTLVRADVSLLADEELFFVFEDEMEDIMLAFTRDTEVSTSCAVPPHPYLLGRGENGLDHGCYPPSGVLPFQGLAAYAAPLCYLYTTAEERYYVFRAMYTRHFCRLHTMAITGLPSPSLPNLCATFEGILQEAFVNHLNTEQACALTTTAEGGLPVLLLWDRVVGFDSLLPLPLLAVAIFSFRRDALLAATSAGDCFEVLEHIHNLHAIPLLQHLLF